MFNRPYEIERKYLIHYPDLCLLKDIYKDFKKTEIEQLYLDDKEKSRIRKAVSDGKTRYIKTVKRKISDITRIEAEEDITAEEFNKLSGSVLNGFNKIVKTRYSFGFCGHIIEIDVFPFWNDRAFLEVELEDENEEIVLPEEISVIKEVTFDKRYTNRALAQKIPYDNL